MRVFISADMEGCTGLVSWGQCEGPDGRPDWAFARRMMTHDVNAAIRGLRAGGAEEIVVKDSHNTSKNLLIDELEHGVHLVSGHGAGEDGMMQGIDGTFDAAVLVGYHAMAGTGGGVMEHTLTGSLHRLWINGNETGEMGLSALVAGGYGVPLIAVASDQAGCDEAEALVPDIATAVTKTGLGRYMADVRHPSTTSIAIESACAEGLRKRDKISTVWIEGEVEIKLEFNRTESADRSDRLPGLERIDGYTVGGTFPDFGTAHLAVWNILSHGAAGLRSLD
ncbi:aminopeptidase [bacterium]|nr:MAG: aminopeptidase [bacterium]